MVEWMGSGVGEGGIGLPGRVKKSEAAVAAAIVRCY